MRVFVLAAALLAAPVARAGEPPALRAQDRTVVRAVDGDTLVLDGGERVRLIGVDAPETEHTRRKSGPECFGREATAFTRERAVGRRVRVELEPGEPRDRYGRTLAYVYLGDGAFLNLELLERGYARVYRAMPRRFREAFVHAEGEARADGRGMWGPPCRSAIR